MSQVDVILEKASNDGVTLAFVHCGNHELVDFSLSHEQALGFSSIYATDPFPGTIGTLHHEIIELFDLPKRAVVLTSKGKSRRKTKTEISNDLYFLIRGCWRGNALPSALEQ